MELQGLPLFISGGHSTPNQSGSPCAPPSFHPFCARYHENSVSIRAHLFNDTLEPWQPQPIRQPATLSTHRTPRSPSITKAKKTVVPGLASNSTKPPPITTASRISSASAPARL